MRLKPIAIALVGLVIVAGVVIYWQPQQQQQQQQQQAKAGKGKFGKRGGPPGTDPVPVLAIDARRADVPVYLDGVGTARALNTVTVKPQVEGKLIAISFTEGQEVPQGYVLAKIDPTTFQAQYDQAVATKAFREAQLANAKLDLERYMRLAATNAINKQQVDTQRALVAQLEAQVRADQAIIDNARAILSYTDITAPIAGRTGIRQVDEGNIVRPSETTGLVIITQIRPISVLFNLPQQELPELQPRHGGRPLPVQAMGPDGRTPADRGQVQVIDNQVDPDHRHGAAESRVSERQPPALAGTVRQCAAVDRHHAPGGGGADRGRAARPDRHLRLRHRRGGQGRGAAGDGREAGRRADRDRHGRCRPASGW